MGRLMDYIRLGFKFFWIALPYALVAYVGGFLLYNCFKIEKKNNRFKFQDFQEACYYTFLDITKHFKLLFKAFGQLSDNVYKNLQANNKAQTPKIESDHKNNIIEAEFKEVKNGNNKQ